MLSLFKGEKTTLFYIGLISLGYSIYQFCFAGWQIIFYDFIYPAMVQEMYGNGVFDPTSLIGFQSLSTVVPGLIGGVIFLIIGLYLMNVGVKRVQPPTQK